MGYIRRDYSEALIEEYWCKLEKFNQCVTYNILLIVNTKT
ncbi:hypothetical protein DFP78_102790 [Photobacterium lutimaris]|nr:hypothetical protein DFP78_102790 [Photobacterium lutimaris]